MSDVERGEKSRKKKKTGLRWQEETRRGLGTCGIPSSGMCDLSVLWNLVHPIWGAVVMVNHETTVYLTKCPSLAAILHGMFSRVCRRSDGVLEEEKSNPVLRATIVLQAPPVSGTRAVSIKSKDT